MTALISSALALSLLGSFHCMGMCGGFALLANHTSTKRLSPPLLFYFMGKTAVYTVAGVLIGALGATFHHSPAGSRILSVLVGLTMVWIGLALVGKNPLSRFVTSAGFPRLISTLQQVAGTTGNSSRFWLGFLNGLLPCGLLYAAFAGAAQTGSPLKGGLFMLIFGLGTLPSLFVAVHAVTLFSPENRIRLVQITAWLIVLYGVITIVRGLGLMH